MSSHPTASVLARAVCISHQGQSKPTARSRLLAASQPPQSVLHADSQAIFPNRSDDTSLLKTLLWFSLRQTKSLRPHPTRSVPTSLFWRDSPLCSLLEPTTGASSLSETLSLPLTYLTPTWPAGASPGMTSSGIFPAPKVSIRILCINHVPYLGCTYIILHVFDQCLSSPLWCKLMAMGVLFIISPAPDNIVAHNRCSVC